MFLDYTCWQKLLNIFPHCNTYSIISRFMDFWYKRKKERNNINGILDIIFEKQCTTIWFDGSSCNSQCVLKGLIRYSGLNIGSLSVLHSWKQFFTNEGAAKEWYDDRKDCEVRGICLWEERTYLQRSRKEMWSKLSSKSNIRSSSAFKDWEVIYFCWLKLESQMFFQKSWNKFSYCIKLKKKPRDTYFLLFIALCLANVEIHKNYLSLS